MTGNDIIEEAAAQAPDAQIPNPTNSLNIDNHVPLPPAMAAMHGKSSSEILAALNKTPLFMTELEENDELEAFKALAYEGTAAEISLNFKERGNECFKAKQWTDAKEFYTKGIQVLQAAQRKRATEEEKSMKSKETSMNIEEIKNPDQQSINQELQILEASLLNRAATHLSLQNYRSTTHDCAAVLGLNPSNLKAHHRSAKALLALHHLNEASAILSRALKLAPTNPSLLELVQTLQAQEREAVHKRERKEREEREKRLEGERLRLALRSAGVRVRATGKPPDIGDVGISLAAPQADESEAEAATRDVLFPVMFLYPLHLQSDFITRFAGTETLRERLEEVLAEVPVWDREGEYTVKGVDCFMETVSGGLVKVGRNLPLLQVLGRGNVEVVDQVVRIFVLPRKRSEAWVREFKIRKAPGGTG